MKSFDYYRNKNVLGELTLGELMKSVPIEGEFTIGENWLPIVRTSLSKRKGSLRIFMGSLESRDPELEIPLDAKVSAAGKLVSMRIGWGGYPNGRLVRIRLDSAPKWML